MNHLLYETSLEVTVGPTRDLWPLLLVPLLAATLRGQLLQRPAETPAASSAQLVLAAAPGGLVLVLIAYAFFDSFPPDKALRWSPAWVLAPALGVALVGFATVRLVVRLAQVRTLFRASVPAQGAIARLGSALGLRVRQIDTDAPVCFVAGFLRPTAFVGSAAARRLSEPELRAALLHEQAHACAFDTLRLLVLSVCCDLLPIGGRRSVAVFVAGRERLADAAAVRTCAPADLAAAILRLPGRAGGDALVLPMAAGDHLRWRLDRLLADGQAVRRARRGEFIAAAFAVSLSAWPLLQHGLQRIYCRG